MGNMVEKIKEILFLSFFIISLFQISFAKIVVINSKNWIDVYSGIYYSQLNGLSVYFLNSPNPAGLFNILPKEKNVLLIESRDPLIPNLKTLLEARGYVIEEKKVSNANLDLLPKEIKNFVVVESDLPYAAIVAAPLAKVYNAWVLIVDDANIDKIIPILSKAEKVVGIGYFKRSIKNRVQQFFDEEITSTNKFELSVLVAKKYLEKRPVKQVLITDGKHIENELLLGASPILIVGENLLPDNILNFMMENGIKTAVVIGSHLTYVGERIRALSNRKISVFIKFGEATAGVSPTIYALTMFPLTTKELKLNITQVFYDPKTQKLYVTFKNLGDIGLFEFTTLRILANGKEIASLADTEPIFIGANEVFVKAYNIVIPSEYLTHNLTAQFYTSYGESSDNLDKYITAKGKFGPPLTLKIKIAEIQDNSKLSLLKVSYYPYYKRFGIKVKNDGDVDTWFIVKLINVKIQGIKNSLSTEDTNLILSEAEREVFIPATLDEIDLRENEYVRVRIEYGENKNLLVNSIDKTVRLEIVNINPITGFFLSPIGLTIVGLVVVVVALIVLRKFMS